jgi:TctA family transporter
LLAALLFGQELFVAIEPLSIQGFECSKELVLYAIVPTLFLYALLQSLSPQASRLVAALCFVASGILGSIFLEFNCSLEDPNHILVFHILPLLMLGGFGMLLGRVIFSLDRRVARLKKALEQSVK